MRSFLSFLQGIIGIMETPAVVPCDTAGGSRSVSYFYEYQKIHIAMYKLLMSVGNSVYDSNDHTSLSMPPGLGSFGSDHALACRSAKSVWFFQLFLRHGVPRPSAPDKTVMAHGVGDTSWRADTRMTTQPCCFTRDPLVGPVGAFGADERPMRDVVRDACVAGPWTKAAPGPKPGPRFSMRIRHRLAKQRGSVMNRRGFTLIELLVVITIIVALAGILLPVLGIANRASRITATRSVMVKVDTGLRLFRAEFGPYPWQESYADLATGAAWTNRLYWFIGTDMSEKEYLMIRKDADKAAYPFEYADSSDPRPFYLRDRENFAPGDWHAGMSSGFTIQLNRMAAERTRLAILSGNVGITCPQYPSEWVQASDVDSMRHVMRPVKPTTPLLAAPTAARLGMAKDYLRGEVEQRYVSGEAIIDAWKRPLIYICQVVEGMTSQPMLNGNGVGTLSAIEWGMQPLGRKTLAFKDGITGQPLTAAPPLLPDLSNLRHSDRRHYAAPGLEIEFEVWSAGPDGQADWMRDAAVNNDNISLLPYDKNIP